MAPDVLGRLVDSGLSAASKALARNRRFPMLHERRERTESGSVRDPCSSRNCSIPHHSAIYRHKGIELSQGTVGGRVVFGGKGQQDHVLPDVRPLVVTGVY
jgi:hypothetical protein